MLRSCSLRLWGVAMALLSGKQDNVASEIDGRGLRRTGVLDKSAQRPVTHINGERIYFRDLARMVWPDKTDQHLSFITECDARTCRRWLSGENEPPADVLAVILSEIMRRYHQRE